MFSKQHEARACFDVCPSIYYRSVLQLLLLKEDQASTTSESAAPCAISTGHWILVANAALLKGSKHANIATGLHVLFQSGVRARRPDAMGECSTTPASLCLAASAQAGPDLWYMESVWMCGRVLCVSWRCVRGDNDEQALTAVRR